MSGGSLAPDARKRLFTDVAPAPSGEGWRDDSHDFRLAVERPGVLDAHQCEVLLGYIDQFGQAPGQVGSEDDSEGRVDPDVRQVRQTNLPRTPETAWVYEQLASAVDGCNRQFFGFDLRDFNEQLVIVDYRSGDFYEWHLDMGRGREASTRKLSVSVLLSSPEDYDGGALAFPTVEFDRTPRGGAVVFPSYLLHGIRPVKQGRRCALLAWIGGPRFR